MLSDENKLIIGGEAYHDSAGIRPRLAAEIFQVFDIRGHQRTIFFFDAYHQTFVLIPDTTFFDILMKKLTIMMATA